MTKAVYAGSFDPVTNGHLWVIRKAREIFGHLIVAIGENPAKKYTFTVAERMAMLKDSLVSLPTAPGDAIVEVDYFTNQYLMRYAKAKGATHIVRGMRNVEDFEFERLMLNINGDIDSDITTIYLIPPRHLAEVSSSAAKALCGPEGWREIVSKMVPPSVMAKLILKYDVGL